MNPLSILQRDFSIFIKNFEVFSKLFDNI